MTDIVTGRFTPGFRLIDGSELNAAFEQVNMAMDGTTPAVYSGEFTPSAGENFTGKSRYSTVPIGSVAYGSFGNNTTLVAGTVYLAELFIPRNMTLTGVAVLNGGTVGTDSGLVAIFDSAGALVANSALAGAATSGANAFQARNFTATVDVVGPARYWVAYQQNGTTDTLRTIAASTFIDCLTKSSTGTFGTVPAQTPPTTFTANVGPIAYVY